ncbi:MAG: hypothetical protein Q8O44_05880, partial [Syntrophales bacterium]|nr:hypothetical protein [Syntrophales bacterium]
GNKQVVEGAGRSDQGQGKGAAIDKQQKGSFPMQQAGCCEKQRTGVSSDNMLIDQMIHPFCLWI